MAYTRQIEDTKSPLKQNPTVSTKPTQNTFTAARIKWSLWTTYRRNY